MAEGRQTTSATLTARIERQRPVHTYAEVWHAANCLLDAGLERAEGSTWQFLSSAVLRAFAFEAYLNHIGSDLLDNWQEIERSRLWEKAAAIQKALGVSFPGGRGARPLKTVARLFVFRNSLAHGRSETLSDVRTVRVSGEAGDLRTKLDEQPLMEWEALVQNGDFAELARTDVETVITALHEARRCDEILFNSGAGHQSATITP